MWCRGRDHAATSTSRHAAKSWRCRHVWTVDGQFKLLGSSRRMMLRRAAGNAMLRLD
jgi:hypothetical protein